MHTTTLPDAAQRNFVQLVVLPLQWFQAWDKMNLLKNFALYQQKNMIEKLI
jgi:hypothetical protein